MSKGNVSLPSLLTGYYGQSSINSTAFQSLVRALGEARSKLEEDRLVKKELKTLKEKINKTGISPKQMREYLVRLIYCEMLGHEVEFGYFYAVQFAQQSGLMEKRTGYLAVSLFLHENHQFIMLLVNTLQKDLKSSNMLEVCSALTVVCKLISADMIPALRDSVFKLLGHDREIVRMKAVMVLYRFYVKAPTLIPDIKDKARRALCDPDPGVVAAALNLFKYLIQEDPSKYKDLVPSFVAVLKQIVEKKFPKEFEYNGSTIPWMNICLLQILAELGKDDLRSSECMYEILRQAMSEATEKTIASAVLYECLKTVATIYPNPALIRIAMKWTEKFLTHQVNDIKYLGINAMASLVRIQPDHAVRAEVQNVIIDCLNDDDETIKRKTLDLLCQITNPSNVVVVCDRLLSFLRSTTDTFFREGIVTKITELAEKFAPDTSWYLLVMNEVFELGGSLVQEEVAHNLMRLIAEGLDDELEDNQLRHNAVISYLGLLYKPFLPDLLVKLICWVVSEYAYIAEEYEPGEILDNICGLLDRKFEEPDTRCWVITAIGKLVAQLGHVPENVKQLLINQCRTVSVDVRQRCNELLMLSNDMDLMREIFPLDSSCEEIEVDGSLSFLDELVSESLRQGMEPYKPKPQRGQNQLKRIEPEVAAPKLRFEPYESPAPPVSRVHMHSPPGAPSIQPQFIASLPTGEAPTTNTRPEDIYQRKNISAPTSSTESGRNNLDTKGKKLWSKEGYLGNEVKHGKTPEAVTFEPKSASFKTHDIGSPGKDNVIQPSPVQSLEEIRKKNLKQALFGGVSPPESSSTVKIKQSISKARKQEKNQQNNQPCSHSDNASISSTPSSGSDTLSNHSSGVKSKSRESLPLAPSLDIPSESSSFPSHVEKSTDAYLVDDLLLLDISNSVLPAKEPDVIATESKSTYSLEDNPAGRCSLNGKQTEEILVEKKDHPQSQTNFPLSLLDSDIQETRNPAAVLAKNTTCLTVDLLAFPHSKEQQEISNDGTLRITLQRVWKPDELVLVLFLTNQSSKDAISDISLKIEPSSNIILTQSRQALITVEEIQSSQTKMFLVELKLKSPSLNTKFSGQASYKDSTKTLKRTFLQSHTINISDFLRPLRLTTEAFGKRWTSTSNDKKEKLKSRFTTCQELMDEVAQVLNLYVVQIIGSEGIAVGTVLQSGICLLHSKVENGFVSLWVKSNSQLLSEVVLKQCTNVFKEK